MIRYKIPLPVDPNAALPRALLDPHNFVDLQTQQLLEQECREVEEARLTAEAAVAQQGLVQPRQVVDHRFREIGLHLFQHINILTHMRKIMKIWVMLSLRSLDPLFLL